MDELVETSTPEPTAQPAAPEESGSLSDHESLFGAPDQRLQGDAKAKNDEARQKVRHRAASQQATTDDVETINRLTARAKAAERASGIERHVGESDRVYALRVRTELYERNAGKVSSGPPTPAERPSPAPERPAPSAQSGGDSGQPPSLPATRPKPTMEMVGDGLKYATFEDYNEDLVDWKVEQREAKRDAERAEKETKAQNDRAQTDYVETMKKAAARMAAFKADHDDFDDLLTQHQGLDLPQSVFKAIAVHDNGPAMVYHLLTNAKDLADVLLLFRGSAPTDDYVALATQWLTSRVQAAPTGSAAAAPPIALAPRPPNPVRTGPQRTADETPGEDAPLSAHERKYAPQRR